MKTFDYVIKDEIGIHARPAGLLVKFVGTLSSDIKLAKGDKEADAKRLFAIMGLAAKCGDTITLSVSGENEEADAKALEEFLAENL